MERDGKNVQDNIVRRFVKKTEGVSGEGWQEGVEERGNLFLMTRWLNYASAHLLTA